MTLEDFSDEFDSLTNSFSGVSSISFDEYEKSVFLTKAQEDLVISLYNGTAIAGESFESTEEMRRYLSNLVAEAVKDPLTNTNGIVLGVSSTSKFFTLPPDLWFITMESVLVDKSKCKENNILKVCPIKQDEYYNIKNNPFRGINDRRALRLDLSEGNVEIICKYPVTKYYVRYIKRVPPIILINLPDNLSINKESNRSECILHEALHKKIIELAVRMALQSKGYSLVGNKGKDVNTNT